MLFAFSSLLTACNQDSKDIILDGISIGDQATEVKLKAISADNKTSTGVHLSGGITDLDNNYAITDIGFVISSGNNQPDTSDLIYSFGKASMTFTFDSTIIDLSPNTVYYARTYVLTSKGAGYGNVLAFQTSESPADVIVINEGNFSSGDGSFSTYNSLTNEVSLSVFAAANGFPVAGTVQNARVFNGNIYATTNDADKLEVFDQETFVSKAYINSGLNSPFDFAAIGDKGYVTNWGTLNYDTYAWENSFIAVVDLKTNTISNTINLEEQPQHILAVGNSFYVANVSGNTISVYSANDDSKQADISVSAGPDNMVLDKGGNIWVMCTSGNLVQIDPSSNSVIKTISNVQNSGYNEKLTIDAKGENIYYLASSGWPDYNTNIYSISIDVTEVSKDPVISGTNYYGIGVSPGGMIYVSDANAFQGNGTVYTYDLKGNQIETFAAGRGPNGFIFR